MFGSQIKEQLDGLIRDCQECAQVYADSPGLVQPTTIVDVYQAIARLARIIATLEEKQRVGF